MTAVHSRPLRIGIITNGLEERRSNGAAQIANGGVGVYIYHLVKELQAIDATNQYFLIRYGRGELDIYHSGRSRDVFLRGSRFSATANLLDLPYRRLAAELQLDLIHYPNQFGGAGLPRPVKRVVTLHDITPLLFPHFHPWRRVVGYRIFLRRALRAADHVIVDASHTAEDLVARGFAARDRIGVIPLGVAARFRPGVQTAAFRSRFDLPDRFILSVGVLEPRKNHALLVNALQRLHDCGERVGLVIVGRDGWSWKAPLDANGSSGLRPYVRVLRNVSDADLVELYNRAEVFAYPSLYEGFGLPLLEAMACGTPVVAARTSSLPEVAGAAALLAAPHDGQEFADHLLAVLRGPALRERLVADGLRRAAEFSWRRTAARTLAVYERVCAGSLDAATAPRPRPAEPAAADASTGGA